MNQVYEKEKELHREVAEKVESSLPDVEVLAVELRGPETLCVYLDRRGAKVDHALCEEATGVLREYLDRYSLEVSSPGIERPLRTQSHFSDAVGRRVALRTGTDIDGRKRFRGTVLSAGDDAVTLDAGGEIAIPYSGLVR
jgi:ribosome maturation factor RimP